VQETKGLEIGLVHPCGEADRKKRVNVTRRARCDGYERHNLAHRTLLLTAVLPVGSSSRAPDIRIPLLDKNSLLGESNLTRPGASCQGERYRNIRSTANGLQIPVLSCSHSPEHHNSSYVPPSILRRYRLSFFREQYSTGDTK